MKKARNILLLLLSASLLVGCSNGWNTSTSSASSEQSQPSSSSSEPEPPVPPEPGDYDVDYPIVDPGINPINSDQVDVIFDELFEVDHFDRAIRDYLGSETYDALLSCNHMKDEQIAQAINVFGLIMDASMGRSEPGPSFAYQLVENLGGLDMDAFILTAREITRNEQATSGLARCMRFRPSLFRGPQTSYQNADAFFKGSDARITKAAQDEKLFDETFFVVDGAETFNRAITLVNDDGSLGLFRFFGHVATSIVEHLSKDDALFLLANMFGESNLEAREILERLAPTYMASKEVLAEYMHRVGAAFTEMNLSEESWALVLPALEEFVKFNVVQDKIEINEPYSQYNYDTYSQLIADLFENVGPASFKAIFKLAGLLFENATPDVAGLITEETEHLDCVSSLYNKAYGLLTEAQRNALDRAFFFFGISLAEFNEQLEELCENDDMPGLEELLGDVNSKIGMAFYVQEEDIRTSFYNSSTSVLYFRQGDTISTATLQNILAQGNDFFRFRVQGYEREEDISKRIFTLYEPIDTTEPGVKRTRAKFTVYVPTSSSENPEYASQSFEVYMQYTVVPRDIQFFAESIYSQVNVNGTSVGQKPIADSAGTPVGKINDWILLEKGKTTQSSECNSRSYLDDAWVYSTKLGRYVSLSSNLVNKQNDLSVDLSTLDTSTVGLHYKALTLNVKIDGTEDKIIPAYLGYQVVNKIAYVEDGTSDSHIELD